MSEPVKPPEYLCTKKRGIMFGILIFMALVVNVLGSITGGRENWGE